LVALFLVRLRPARESPRYLGSWYLPEWICAALLSLLVLVLI
jgi:hypothetical protein